MVSKLENEINSADEDNQNTLRALLQVVKVWLVRLYFRILLYGYYREIDVIGIENVPLTGPVIFCGNHQNQFVDGVMLYAHCPREPSFIIAKKSMGRRVVGDVAKFMNCIPVRRPQDEAKPASGLITQVTTTKVYGNSNTKFTSEIKSGELLMIKPNKDSAATYTVKVTEVSSDNELVIREVSDPPTEQNMTFKVLPRIEQKEMWEAVYDRLGRGGSIGIFPEGGSHDQTSMLNMKDGIARFALGAIEHGTKRPVIVPVGLTYYYGHRFRSRAHIEFGQPMHVTDEMYSSFQADRQQGISLFMNKLSAAMAEVTIQCPDWRTLKIVHHVRRLYQPGRIKLDVAEYLRTTRRFAQGMTLVKDLPETEDFVKKLEQYQDLLKKYLVTDHQVQSLERLPTQGGYKLLIKRMYNTAFWFVVCIPGIIINLPIALIARFYSDIKSKEAVLNSTVKVMGNDVKASYKVICALIISPLYLSLIFFIVWGWTSYGMACLTMVVYPFWSYWSIVCANNCMLSARATFPLLLSLQSDYYNKRFKELHQFRRQLVKQIRNLVDTKVRGKYELWSERSEHLFKKIEALSTEEVLETSLNSTPFAVEHTSRLKSPVPSRRSSMSNNSTASE
eukprot:TRINITY_DN1367_c8_g1_i1.p1 TRINITY_DN1367_c8_g1~~TRINITY_DN1367_c8_g1_i1.p1  ORF type:complete len:618 (+),score=106.22 TRINITY_DN1367_c8_g1_i1:56-1909(+)